MSCSSPNLLRYSYLQEFSKAIFILICVVDTAIFLSASLGNILILISLHKSQAIHSPSKALFSSLALSDLAVGVIVAPLHFGLTLGIVQDNPLLYCTFFAPTTAAGYTMASVSTLTAVAIALDRYLAFRLRIRYRQLVTVNRVVLLLSLVWIIGILFALSWTFDRNISHIVGACATFLCTTTTFYCYLKIFVGLRHQAAQIQEQNQVARASHRQFFNIPVYKQSVKNMFLIYCVILICYLPYFLALMLLFSVGLGSSTFLVLSLSYVIISLNSSLNPFVYCWRIREIRRQVLSILSGIYSMWAS